MVSRFTKCMATNLNDDCLPPQSERRYVDSVYDVVTDYLLFFFFNFAAFIAKIFIFMFYLQICLKSR